MRIVDTLGSSCKRWAVYEEGKRHDPQVYAELFIFSVLVFDRGWVSHTNGPARVLTCVALQIEARGAHVPPSSSFSSSSSHNLVTHAVPDGIAQSKVGNLANATKQKMAVKIFVWALVRALHISLHSCARLISNEDRRCLICFLES